MLSLAQNRQKHGVITKIAVTATVGKARVDGNLYSANCYGSTASTSTFSFVVFATWNGIKDWIQIETWPISKIVLPVIMMILPDLMSQLWLPTNLLVWTCIKMILLLRSSQILKKKFKWYFSGRNQLLDDIMVDDLDLLQDGKYPCKRILQLCIY